MWPWLTTDTGLTCHSFNHTITETDCHSIFIEDTEFTNFNPFKRILIDACVDNSSCKEHTSRFYYASGFVLAV